MTSLFRMAVLSSAALVGALGCGKAAPATFTLSFAAKVDTSAFACGQTYSGIGSTAAQAEGTDLRFYIHDVQLVTATGRTEPLELTTNAYQSSGVALLDFENGEGACTDGDATTSSDVVGTAPAGTYSGVRFTLGVPAALNHEDLTSQPSPLNKSSLYWSWRMGHIFLAATTRAANPASPGTFQDHLTHVGATACEGDPAQGQSVTSCAKPNRTTYSFELDLASDVVVFDLKRVKEGVDVTLTTGCHSFTDACIVPFDHLGIDWATGAATPQTQTVFRIEKREG